MKGVLKMAGVPTQKERIRQYMEDFGSITPLEALRDLGIMRLTGADLGNDPRR